MEADHSLYDQYYHPHSVLPSDPFMPQLTLDCTEKKKRIIICVKNGPTKESFLVLMYF
jgi:hypothetical protein